MDKKMEEALLYAVKNSTLSFHHVAVKFGVDAHKLQTEFAKRYHGVKAMEL